MWTPYQINIMLHYHCCVGPWPLYTAPIFQGTVGGLVEDGLLQHAPEGAGPNCYETTALGRALISLWCDTPIPETRFVDPRFEDALPRRVEQ